MTLKRETIQRGRAPLFSSAVLVIHVSKATIIALAGAQVSDFTTTANKLSSPPPLAFQRPLHRSLCIVYDGGRPVLRLAIAVFAPDARAHEDRLPFGTMRAMIFIGAADIALGIIPDHIHAGQRFCVLFLFSCFFLAIGSSSSSTATALLEQRGPPLRQHRLGELVRPRVRLADRRAPHLRLSPRDLVPDTRERGLEGALAEPREVVPGAPEEVVVTEIQVRLAVGLPPEVIALGPSPVLRGVRPEHAVLGQEQIHDNLDVDGPVARVVEDENGVDLRVGRRQGPRRGRVVVLELRLEGEYGWVRHGDVGGRDNGPESVRLGDEARFGWV